MNKYTLALILSLTGMWNMAQARIRGNIPATYIENRELVFRQTRMNSETNPLQVQIVVDDSNGNELSINLPVTIGQGGNKATVTMPTVGADTRISFEVWGGKFSKEDRFKHTMILFDDPLLNLRPVLDQGEELIAIPNEFSSTNLFGKEGPQGPQGIQGPTGPQGPPGPAMADADMLDNSNQTLNLGGVNGANVTINANKSGNVNVTLPNNGGMLGTIDGPTPVAIDPTGKDLEGINTISAKNINYITITDSNNTTTDTLQYITGGSKGQQLILELAEDINFYADNQDIADTIQWGRGTAIGAVLPANQREIFRFIHNGTAWFLIDRFTL